MGSIRLAVPGDAEAIRRIYNEEVLHGIATFDLHPMETEAAARLVAAHQPPLHPLIVMTAGEDIAGWGSLSPYRTKEAYRTTAELSVYVDGRHRREGVGSALMAELLRMARAAGELHLIVSVITSGNEASERLHRRFGFSFGGHMPECGKKFGRWLGTDTWYLQLESDG